MHVLAFEFVCIFVHKAGECSLFNIAWCWYANNHISELSLRVKKSLIQALVQP